MMVRMSSGSSLADRAVEPTRSQNRTVNCRRSASVARVSNCTAGGAFPSLLESIGVESIGVDQSVPGRILGYGTLTITGSGGSSEPYTNIAKPLHLRSHVQKVMEDLESDGD